MIKRQDKVSKSQELERSENNSVNSKKIINEKELYNENRESINSEEEEKEENNDDQIKVNMPFNNKVIMIIISLINFLSGVSTTYYAFTVLYYMNNPYAYKRHLFISFNYTIKELDDKLQIMNKNKAGHYSITNNYLIFGILQLICSFFAFLIRVPRFNWKKDILPYVCYEGLANLSCFGSLVLWFLMLKVNNFLEFSSDEVFFKYCALILSFASFIFKLITSKWSFNDYFDVVNIDDIVLK
jgi:hypothetical protein